MAADPATTPLLSPENTCPVKKPTGWCQQRYVFVVLGFFGFFNVYVLRVNLSVALVAMVNGTVEKGNETETNECPADKSSNGSNTFSEGEFDWSTGTQGVILSSFFYGYLVTQLPGGLISDKFGGKWPFGIGVFMTGVFTLLTPLAARTNVYLLIAVRVLEGLGEGVTPAAVQAMVGRWAPPFERSTMSTAIFVGCQFGTVVSLPVSGWISNYLGWEYVFYICGAVACLWFFFWAGLVFNSPSEHPRISEEEKQYIIDSIGEAKTKHNEPVPWKGMLTSIPFWSLTLVHTGLAYLFYTLLTDLPTYMKTVLHFHMNENGLLSALPYLVYAIIAILYSPFTDWLLSKGYLRTITVRKVSTAIGALFSGAFMIGTAWIGCNYNLGVLLLTISCGTLAFSLAGYIPNCVDIAPRLAGPIFGIVNTFGTIAGIVAPLVVGALTKNNQTQQQWRYIFFIAGGFCICSAVPYLLFTKTDRAAWSMGRDEKPFITASIADERRRLITIQKPEHNGEETAE